MPERSGEVRMVRIARTVETGLHFPPELGSRSLKDFCMCVSYEKNTLALRRFRYCMVMTTYIQASQSCERNKNGGSDVIS